MCTRNCPCKSNAKQGEWTSMLAAQKATFLRTKEFVFTQNTDIVTYETYDKCIENIKDGSVAENMAAGYTGTKAFYEFAKNFREQGDFTEIKEWIEFFEDEYECAGICKPALFNWIQKVDEGKPIKSCVSAVKDDLTSSFMGLGIATLANGILLFLIWLFQYCLWRRYD